MSFDHLIEERESNYLIRRLSKAKPFRFEYERCSARFLIRVVQSFGCACFARVRPPSVVDAFLFTHPHGDTSWVSVTIGNDYGGYSSIELHRGPVPVIATETVTNNKKEDT